MRKYANMTTPASFGVEWASDGSRFQLVNPRGTTSLLFGVKPESRDMWTTTTVDEPSRFGLTESPKSYDEFLSFVRAFAEPPEDEES